MSDLPAPLPVDWVRLAKFDELTGIPESTVKGWIKAGVWIEGKQYKVDTNSKVYVSLRGYHAWVENQFQAA